MSIIKIKRNVVSETEFEITLPYYTKDNCHFFKIYSESKCIKVYDIEPYGCGISIEHSSLAFSSDNIEKCTEAEFLDAYNTVKNKLEELCL